MGQETLQETWQDTGPAEVYDPAITRMNPGGAIEAVRNGHAILALRDLGRAGIGANAATRDRRNDGQDRRPRHRDLCAQQAAGQHVELPARADRALCAWRDLSLRVRLRSQARWPVLDGIHRLSRL